jgi:hypothetical protein
MAGFIFYLLSELPEPFEPLELPLCDPWDPLDLLVWSFGRCEVELPVPED